MKEEKVERPENKGLHGRELIEGQKETKLSKQRNRKRDNSKSKQGKHQEGEKENNEVKKLESK